MAHLLAPQNYKITLPVFYNVDGVVGAGPAVNNREDVYLVQYAFNLIASKPFAGSSPEFHKAAAAVRVTGSIDQATIDAIRAAQIEAKKSQPNAVVDGRVSPATGYGYGSAFTIVNLNESVQNRYLDLWPRIDQIKGCPEDIKKMVIRTVRGT